MTPQFSVIVPVYNRRDEVDGLLGSLAAQQCPAGTFEVIVVEDGSPDPCGDIVRRYASGGLDARYFFKDNEGRSPARNYGIERSRGGWLLFFDSDCVIPADYFTKLSALVRGQPCDCYGGPDAAADDFTPTQKAINYAMTSFLTTGGIRGGHISASKFVPRTFNMGFRREVYDTVGGFREMFSEDIDMSTRIRRAGFTTTLYSTLPVYHKRRVDFAKFFRQVHVFGMSRVTLQQLYPGSLRLIHTLPSAFVVGCLTLILLALCVSPWWALPVGIYLTALFATALHSTKSLRIAALAVPASVIQLTGYGTGLLRALFTTYILGRGRRISLEVEMRRGK